MFWRKKVELVKIPGPPEDYRKTFQAIVDELAQRPPVMDYNDLVPPSNPLFPWKADGWQMLCYYCNQPIFYEKDGTLEAGYRQRGPLNLTWRHENHEWRCKLENIRRDIDLPRCHVCGIQTLPHRNICSVGGPPSFHATTMSRKEDEVRGYAEGMRGEALRSALFDLLQVYEGGDSYHEKGLTLDAAVRQVLKASPWGKSVK